MRERLSSEVPFQSTWSGSINVDAYDCTIQPSESERVTLDTVFTGGALRRSVKEQLHRLLAPLEDVFAILQLDYPSRKVTIRLMCLEMHRRQRAFWGWTMEEWCESIGLDREQFAQRYHFTLRDKGDAGLKGRQEMAALVYLLCPPFAIDPLCRCILITPLARKLFGSEVVTAAVQRIGKMLQSWGYHVRAQQKLTCCISYLLLQNRSPSLDDLTCSFLQWVDQHCTMASVQEYLFQVSRALATLGSITQPLQRAPSLKAIPIGGDEQISEEWHSWCHR